MLNNDRGMSGSSHVINSMSPPPQARPGEFELTQREFWTTTPFSRRYRDYDRDVPSIIEHLYQLKAAQTQNIASGVANAMKSKEGLFGSDFDLFKTKTHEPLKRLLVFIESSICRASIHDAHYHGGCSWCGMFYLQISDVPDQQPDHAPNGINRFYAPRSSGGRLNDYGNHYLGSSSVDFPPSPGTLVLFPAYLLHSGLPYKGLKDLVLLAFNTASYLIDPDGER